MTALCSRCRTRPKGASHRWCNPCKADSMRRTRVGYRQFSPEQKRKADCRSATRRAIRRGAVRRGSCRDCGAEVAQMHHLDYDKPNLVVWLCARCHRAEHANVPRGTH